MKATSHAMSKMILTLTSVAHYQLFLYLNKKCRDLTAVYSRSVTKFVPCGRPPRRLSVDMYEKKKTAPNTTVSLDSSLVVVLLMIGYPMICIERTSSETFGD